LIAAIENNDTDTVVNLSKTKRVLNGKVDYTPPANDAFPNPHMMGKWTALHQCVRLKRKEMMKILIDNGANLEIKDVDGETPTFVASSSYSPEIIKLLLDGGANPNAMDPEGWTCVMISARSGDYETTKALLGAGADLNLGRDMFGRTAFDISAGQANGTMGLRMSQGETHEEALAKHRRTAALLSEHSGQENQQVR
jgi:hypothetical protein